MKKTTYLTFLTVINVFIFIGNLFSIDNHNFSSQSTPNVNVITINETAYKTNDNKLPPYQLIRTKIYHPNNYQPNKNDSVLLNKIILDSYQSVLSNWSYDSINNNRDLFRKIVVTNINHHINGNVPCDSLTCFFN